MAGGTLDYRLRVRDKADSTDLATYSTLPSAAPYCAVVGPPTGDGQSLDPISGRTQISSYDIDIVDNLVVANPTITVLDPFNYATAAAWNAAWTVETPAGTDGTSGSISPDTPFTGSALLSWNGGGGVFGNSNQWYQRTFTGLTPNAVYTVSVNASNAGGYNVVGSQCGFVTGAGGGQVPFYLPPSASVVQAVGQADASGNLTVGLGIWVQSAIHNGILNFSALTIQAGVAGQRIVTQFDDDASAQGQFLGLKAYLEYSTDRGTTWLVLLAGYINRLRLTDALTYRFTVGQTRRADQTIQLFTDTLGVFNAGSCLLGGAIPGGWNGFQDYGPVRWKVSKVGPWGVLLSFVQGPFPSGRLPQQMNMQYGSIGKGQLAYINARAQSYVPGTATTVSAPTFTTSDGTYWLTTDMGLACRVTNVSTGAAVGVFAPRGTTRFGFGPGLETVGLIVPSTNEMALDWTGTGNDLTGAAQPAQPSVGDLFDLYCYPIAVSSDAPVHLAGHPVDLAAQALSLAGLAFDAASATSTKTAVGAAVSLALRITSPLTLSDFLETLYGVFGFSARADATGTHSFFSTDPATATLNGAALGVNDLRDADQDVWAQNDNTVVNRVTLRLRSFGWWSGDTGQSTPMDLVLAGNATVSITDADANSYGIKEQSWELEGQITSVVSFGNGLWGGLAAQTVGNFALGRAQSIFRRTLRGAKEGEIHVRRSSDPGAQVGDLMVVNLPQRPAGTVRGGPRQVQIIQRTEAPEGPSFRLWDTGSTTVTSAPVPTFTLAADASDPTHVVDVTLTNAAAETSAGAVVRVEWGTGASAPSTGTLLGYLLASPGNLTAITTPTVAAGTTVWVRMRAEVAGVQPSAFSAWASLALGGLGSISGLTATAVNGVTELLSWTNTDTTTPVAVYLALTGLTAVAPLVILPPGSAQYTIQGLGAFGGISLTATVRLQESPASFGPSSTVAFTPTGTSPGALTAPTQPSAWAGTPDPVTGVVVIDGSYGIQVRANDADAPGVSIVVQVAVETAVGSGTPGAFSDAGSAAAVLGGFTRVGFTAANDGKKRYLQARETRAGYTDSSESTPVVSVNPWAAVALPPTGTLQPVTVDDETATIPASRQLVAGSGTSIDTATPGQIKVSVGPAAVGFEFGDGASAPSVGALSGARVPFACTITEADIWGDVSGSAVVDVQSSADGITWASIAASAKPTLTAQQSVQDTTLTGWTTAVAAGTWLRCVLNSVSTCKQVSVELKLTRS